MVQGREDEVLVFNTADDAAGALVVGVGADTRQMNGEAMAGLTRVRHLSVWVDTLVATAHYHPTPLRPDACAARPQPRGG